MTDYYVSMVQLLLFKNVHMIHLKAGANPPHPVKVSILYLFFSAERLMTAIEQSRQQIFSHMDGTSSDLSEPLSAKIERISKYGTSKLHIFHKFQCFVLMNEILIMLFHLPYFQQVTESVVIRPSTLIAFWTR